MRTKIFIMILLISFFNVSIVSANNYEEIISEKTIVSNLDKANVLKELGLFLGGNDGFELDREPTRIEGSVMLVRLLGKEEEALDMQYEHPFTDVPDWGNAYVGYLYKYNLTNGIGNNQFGSSELMESKAYVTFILRALGYNDSNGDFTFENSLNKALEIELLEQIEVNELYDFYREDVVLISYNALTKNMKASELKLVDKLIEDGIIDRIKAQGVGLVKDEILEKQKEIFEPLRGKYEVINIGDIELESGNVVYEFDAVSVRYGKNEGGEERIYVNVNRNNLPDSLKDFTYFSMVGFEYTGDETKSGISESIKYTLNRWHKYYDYDSLGRASNGRYDPDGSCDFMELLRIYDENKKLIGYSAIRIK